MRITVSAAGAIATRASCPCSPSDSSAYLSTRSEDSVGYEGEGGQMRLWSLGALLVVAACSGGDKGAADDSGSATTAVVDTGPCRGDLMGSITISGNVDCADGCTGDLLIGWFDTDPTSNPAQEPVEGARLEGVDLAAGPASYELAVLPCGDGFLATLLDVNGDFQANVGDVVPLSGADAGVIRDGQTSTVDQVLNFRLTQ